MTKREDTATALKEIGAFNYAQVRGERITDARDAGWTWVEIAALLGMTENGVHKAYAAYIAKRDGK